MKQLFKAVAFAGMLGLFAACSSSSDNEEPAAQAPAWNTTLVGSYTTWTETKVQSDADQQFVDQYSDNVKVTIAVNATNNKCADVTVATDSVTYVFTGAEVADNTDAYVITSANGTYKSSTKAQVNSNPVKLQAEINKSTKALNYTLTFGIDDFAYTVAGNTANKPQYTKMIGTWEVADENGFQMTWELSDPTLTIKIPTDSTHTMELTPAGVCMFGTAFVNQMHPLGYVTLTADGQIAAKCVTMGTTTDSETTQEANSFLATGYATYEAVSDNQVKVKLNESKIMATADADEQVVLKALIDAVNVDGITVNIKYTDNGAFFYVDQAYLATLLSSDTTIGQTITGLLSQLKDDDLDGFGATLKIIFAQVPNLMAKTTSFQVGFQTVKR